ncbi:hypothetical protein [Spiroplasma endosymbiont of Polydrusus pterygomalis]|uniref:hypothetical protein n=1 Tax=Spiroplasma endosymbiont of Polydrusus pterygomalis TaxID=3139327 RepID=UPI003CCA7392
MTSDNASFDEKIKYIKKQLDNNLDIFKHFKLVCEDYQVCVLNSYNFVANRIKYSFTNDNTTDNGSVLVASEYAKIKKIIARENRFEKILIVASSNSQLSSIKPCMKVEPVFEQKMVPKTVVVNVVYSQ